MEAVNTNLINLVSDAKVITLGLSIVCFAVAGICMIIPSEKAHNFGIKLIPGIIFGTVVALGSQILGDWLYNRVVF